MIGRKGKEKRGVGRVLLLLALLSSFFIFIINVSAYDFQLKYKDTINYNTKNLQYINTTTSTTSNYFEYTDYTLYYGKFKSYSYPTYNSDATANISKYYIHPEISDKQLRVYNGVRAKRFVNLLVFDYPIDINSGSMFYVTANATANHRIDFLFINSSNKCEFILRNGATGWSSFQDYVNNYLCVGDSYTTIDYNTTMWTSGAPKNKTYTFSTEYNNINKIIIVYEGNAVSSSYIYVDSLGLNDIDTLINNTLPTCDFNISKTLICLDNTTDVDLNIDCTDQEGDTIYYSLGQFDYLSRYVFNKETFSDMGWFTQGRFSSNFSYQDDELDANKYINGYSLDPIQILATVSGNNVLVTDTDVTAWSYTLDNAINNITTIDFNLGINADTSRIDFHTYSESGVRQSNISFDYSGGNISIYADGNLLRNKAYPKFAAGFNNYFNIVMLVNPNTDKYYLVITDDDEQYGIWVNNTVTEDVRTLKFNSLYGDVQNEYYIISDLEVKGWFNYYGLDFSTTKPTVEDIDFKTGKIKLFVSDAVHQPDTYNTYSTQITVTSSINICGESSYGGPGGIEDDIPGAIKQFFRGLSDGAGTTSYFQDAIFYVFIALLVIIIITTKNIKLALMGSSFAALICAFIFGSITQIISYIVITAISTVFTVVSQ